MKIYKGFEGRWRPYADAALYWSGAAWLFETVVKPTGAIIVMYHSVATDETARFIDPPNHLNSIEFERQMAYLSRYRKVVPLTSLVESLIAGVKPEAGTVCITFDDGYLDNLTVAAPILAKYQLPATIYLPTAYIDRAETHWADVLWQHMTLRTSDRLNIPSLALDANLAFPDQRRTAYGKLHRPLLVSEYGERQALLEEVRKQLKPVGQAPRLTMSWDDVRKLVQTYPLFEIGGHSRCHTDLSSVSGEIAQREIEGCRNDLQRELGMHSNNFSFPYARWNEKARSLVNSAGWRCAVGNGSSVRIGQESDRFAIPRIPTPTSMTALKFRTSGAYPGVYALIGK